MHRISKKEINKDYKKIVTEVYSKISRYIKKTPLIESSYFSQKTDNTILFKCENLQYINAYKVRGAFNKIIAINDKSKILVTMSGGNYGLAISYAARQFGMKAIIVVPEFIPKYRIDSIRALGGEVVVYGKTTDDLNAKVAEYTKDKNYVYAHPFSDNDVIAGQGTIAYELLQDAPDIDIIIASIGGGGLISGISQYAKSFNSNIKVYGAQTIGTNAMFKSLEAGHLVSIPPTTSVALSLGATKVTDKTLGIVRQYVNQVVTVTDDETIRDLKNILEKDKLLVEPAASCTISALLSGKLPNMVGKKIAVILSGGNISLKQLRTYI